METGDGFLWAASMEGKNDGSREFSSDGAASNFFEESSSGGIL